MPKLASVYQGTIRSKMAESPPLLRYFHSDDGGVLDVRRLRITQKTGEFTGLRRIAPCTPTLVLMDKRQWLTQKQKYMDQILGLVWYLMNIIQTIP